MFLSRAERDRALREIVRGRIPGVVGVVTRPAVLIALGCVLLFLCMSVAGWLVGRSSYQLAPAAFGLGAYILISWIFFWWIHRPAVARFLRHRLRSLGVDVCKKCGYDLRQGRDDGCECPECGTVNERMAKV